MTTARRSRPARTPLPVRFATLLAAALVTLLAGCGSPAQDPTSPAAREVAVREGAAREAAAQEAAKWEAAARDAAARETAAQQVATQDPAPQDPAVREAAVREAAAQQAAREDAERQAAAARTVAREAADREAAAWALVAQQEAAREDGALTGVILGVVGVAVLAGAAVLVIGRRRRQPAFSFSGQGSVAVPIPAQTAPGSRPAPPGAADVPVLVKALREVAAVAPGAAIKQQIRRLLDTGVGRDDLLLACIRYRDQLAERDPATGARLLAALRGVGVEEIRVDGALFDAHHHESVDVTAAPRPELHDRVAQTTRPGYRDGARMVRLPQVVVYRFGPPGARNGQP